MRGQGARAAPLQKLLNANEVADLLGVKLSTVYAWAAQGKLPCVRLGGRVRFDPGDLTRWIQARKEG